MSVWKHKDTLLCVRLFLFFYGTHRSKLEWTLSLSLSLLVCVCVLALALMKPISTASLMAAYTVTGRQREISSIY